MVNRQKTRKSCDNYYNIEICSCKNGLSDNININKSLINKHKEFKTLKELYTDSQSVYVLRVVSILENALVLEYYFENTKKMLTITNFKDRYGVDVYRELAITKIFVCFIKDTTMSLEKCLVSGSFYYIHISPEEQESFLKFFSCYRSKLDQARKLDKRIRETKKQMLLLVDRDMYRHVGFIGKNSLEEEYIYRVSHICEQFQAELNNKNSFISNYDLRIVEKAVQMHFVFSFPYLAKKIANSFGFRGRKVIVPGIKLKLRYMGEVKVQIQHIMYIHHDINSQIIVSKSKEFLLNDINNYADDKRILDTMKNYLNETQELVSYYSGMLHRNAACFLSKEKYICCLTENRIAASELKKELTKRLTDFGYFHADMKKLIKFVLAGHPEYDARFFDEEIITIQNLVKPEIKEFERYNKADVIYRLMMIPEVIELCGQYSVAEDVSEKLFSFIKHSYKI